MASAENESKDIAKMKEKMKTEKQTEQVLDFTMRPNQLKKTQIQLKDFNIIKSIGEGTFGKVYLVEKTNNGELFAMKTLKKD